MKLELFLNVKFLYRYLIPPSTGSNEPFKQAFDRGSDGRSVERSHRNLSFQIGNFSMEKVHLIYRFIMHKCSLIR